MCHSFPIKKLRVLEHTLTMMLLASTPVWAPPASGQANVAANKVVAVIESKTRNSVVLKTERSQALPRPIIQFLPGENGDSVLVADFPGLLWNLPTRVIQVHSSFDSPLGTTYSAQRRGVRLVRVGQFQESPPVCRIAIVSNDPAKLRGVAFKSGKGSLSVSWPTWTSKPIASAPTGKAPPKAPPRARRLPAGTPLLTSAGGVAPSFAPPISPVDPSLASGGPTSQALDPAIASSYYPLRPPIAPAPGQSTAHSPVSAPAPAPAPKPAPAASQPVEEPKKHGLSSWLKKVKTKLLSPEDSQPAQSEAAPAAPQQEELSATPAKALETPPASPGTPPQIALSPSASGNGYQVTITATDRKDLNFTSFRLHGPERFVVDFDSLPQMAQAAIGQPGDNKYLKSLRVGAPEISPGKTVGRLVLDLGEPGTAVIPQDTGNVNVVSFLIGETTDPVAGLMAPPQTVVVVDAGHGGSDPGAQRGNSNEKDITLAIARKTNQYLTDHGVKVLMTRTEDSTVTLADRVDLTNKTNPDAFLSIHINSLESTSDIHGIETYYQTPQSKALAQKIHTNLVKELKAPDRSVRKAKFYVVNRTAVPACLAEVGFISNKNEREKLNSSDYQSKVAGALAKGMILYLKETSSLAVKTSDRKDNTPTQPKGDKIKASAPGDAPVAASAANQADPGVKSTEAPAGLPEKNPVTRASRLAQKGLGISVE